MNSIHTIPLFPLGVNILPDMALPPHIFEERYKLMISECLTRDRSFGIVFFDGQHLHTVGCLAKVTEVVKRYEDGRMDILTRGGRRFVIEKVIDEKPYMEAFVNFLEDSDNDIADDLPQMLQRLESLVAELADLDPAARDLQPLARFDLGGLSFAIAALDGFSAAERQVFLEMTSPVQRIQKGVAALYRKLDAPDKPGHDDKVNWKMLGLVPQPGLSRCRMPHSKPPCQIATQSPKEGSQLPAVSTARSFSDSSPILKGF